MALDGISLTVNDCGPDFLEVNVIPETWRATTVAEWAPGTRINMETDVIGKYVRHMVAPHLGLASEEAKAGKLSVEFLRENGFLRINEAEDSLLWLFAVLKKRWRISGRAG